MQFQNSYHRSCLFIVAIQSMPVILGGELRLPGTSRLRVYRKDRVPLKNRQLIELAHISHNGKQSIIYFKRPLY